MKQIRLATNNYFLYFEIETFKVCSKGKHKSQKDCLLKKT